MILSIHKVMNTNINTIVLDIKQVSKIFGVRETTARSWAKSKKIPGYKIGKQWFFNRNAILDFQSIEDSIKVLGENAKPSHKNMFDILLKDKNDSNKNALELIKLIRGMNVYVNLIPYNETSGNYQASSKVKVMEFYDILKKGGINVTIRREMGKELKAACGQLASRRGGTA